MSFEIKDKEISRKDFLKGVGKTVAGVTILGGVSGLITACSGTETAAPAPAPAPAPAAEMGKPEWPFPYVKLDVAKAEQRAYDAYKTGAG